MQKMAVLAALSCLIVLIAAPAAAQLSCNFVDMSKLDTCSSVLSGKAAECTLPQAAQTPKGGFTGCIKFNGAATFTNASLPTIKLSGECLSQARCAARR